MNTGNSSIMRTTVSPPTSTPLSGAYSAEHSLCATERRMERIADLLATRRHPDRVIEKVIGANWLRLCREVWRG